MPTKLERVLTTRRSFRTEMSNVITVKSILAEATGGLVRPKKPLSSKVLHYTSLLCICDSTVTSLNRFIFVSMSLDCLYSHWVEVIVSRAGKPAECSLYANYTCGMSFSSYLTLTIQVNWAWTVLSYLQIVWNVAGGHICTLWKVKMVLFEMSNWNRFIKFASAILF